YGGRVVETGPAELIRQSPRHHYTRALHDAVPADHPRHRRLAATAVAVGAGSVAGIAGDVEVGTAPVPDAGTPDQIDADQSRQAWVGAGARDSCVFASRCPRAEPRCRQERPVMTAEGGGRSFACFYPI
ncbi:MAG TPA: hypothetical protein VF951_01630, partial [Streptosporangiaceae bacterium]